MHTAPEKSQIGRVLAGRYRLTRVLGHGGMGSVYEAIHVHTEKRVAIKLLAPHLSKDLKLVARFRREAMAASRLEHENCVHVDDFGEDNDGTFYICMEVIDGNGLADELRLHGPMSSTRVVHIGMQLLRALDVAHAAGILHRDLKPQNVMVTQKPNRPDLVKVVDFGIAKITTNSPEDQGALTVPGTIFGTPEYMSPEQARGEVLDARSDLYSAAVVLWHMLLGRSPFRGPSVRETLLKVFSEPPPQIQAERPNAVLPDALDRALRQAMSKKRDDRFRDAAAFMAALKPLATAGVEVPQRPLPGLSRTGEAPPSTIPAMTPAPHPPRFVSAEDKTVLKPRHERPMTIVAGLPQRLPEPTPRSDETLIDPAAVPRISARLSTGAVFSLVGAFVGVLLLVLALVVWLAQRTPDAPRPLVTTQTHASIPAAPASLAPGSTATATAPDPTAPLTDLPTHEEAMRRADAAMALGNGKAAKLAYEDALVANPNSAKAHVGLATIAMSERDWAAAEHAFARAMALDDNYRRKLTAMHERAKKLAERARQ